MRDLVYILLVALGLGAMAGCGDAPKRPGERYRWTPVTPAFDSTVGRLEVSYINPTTFFMRDSLTQSLDSLPLPWAAAQRHYWRARLARGEEEYEEASRMVDSGLAAIDSARYPYEWARLLSIKASLATTPVKTAYELATRNLRYFEATGDSFMLGATLMRLGAVMWSINDTLPAAAYYRRADTVYSRTGPEEYRMRNLVNIANTLGGPETHGRRDSIMRILLESPFTRNDTALYVIILRNSYLNSGDFSHMRRAYDYVSADSGHPSSRAGVEAMMAEYFLEQESADSIMKYARLAYKDIDRVTNQFTRAMIFNGMAFTAYQEGHSDEAIGYLYEYLAARLAMEQERFSLETTKAEYRQGFEKARQEEMMRHSHERTVWITALILACALAVAIGVALYFRVQQARMNRQKAEVQLQQSRNYLSACALAIEEKNRILDSLVESVEKMHTEGKIAGAQAREISATVRRSLNNGLERETFTELHKKLHPEFMRRLKTDYPELTESQLKHAAYIAMGLTSKQIAQALNIEYESVKKSRTRLRNRMNLPRETSLEDVLRGYTL